VRRRSPPGKNMLEDPTPPSASCVLQKCAERRRAVTAVVEFASVTGRARSASSTVDAQSSSEVEKSSGDEQSSEDAEAHLEDIGLGWRFSMPHKAE